MLRDLLDKLYMYKMEETISEVVTIVESQLGGLAKERLEEIGEEVTEGLAEQSATPPDEDQLRMRFPGICEGCEE